MYSAPFRYCAASRRRDAADRCRIVSSVTPFSPVYVCLCLSMAQPGSSIYAFVRLTKDVLERTVDRSNGWWGFRIEGTLDFALVGILSKLSAILAQNKIGIFAVSTFNTDYILVKNEDYERAMDVLAAEGYEIVK